MPLPDKKTGRIALFRENGDLADRDKWPESFKWPLSWAERFKATFANSLKAVELPNPVTAAAGVVEAPAQEAATESSAFPAAPPT
jgi:hypothetical protein